MKNTINNRNKKEQEMNKQNTVQTTTNQKHMSDRILDILSIHSIDIYRNTNKFLEDHKVTYEDIIDNVNINNDQLVTFLEEKFNINRRWIEQGIGEMYKSFCCYKNISTLLDLMKDEEKRITLKLFFDKRILQDSPSLGQSFYLKCVLITEEEFKGVKYKKVYSISPIDWDGYKSHVTLFKLTNGMREMGISPLRTIERYAGKYTETEDIKFISNVLNNFYYIKTSFRADDFSIIDRVTLIKSEIDAIDIVSDEMLDKMYENKRRFRVYLGKGAK